MPVVAQWEGASGVLPQELAQAGGDVDRPKGLEVAQQVNMCVEHIMEVCEPFETEGSELGAQEGGGGLNF